MNKTKSKTVQRAGETAMERGTRIHQEIERKLQREQAKQREQDDLILAAIVAGAQVNPAGIARGDYGLPFRVYTTRAVVPSGPCCAIGCGLLHDDVRAFGETAVQAFAEHYNVSLAYAAAVSEAFETYEDGEQCVLTGENLTLTERNTEDYARGWAVGCAAATLLDTEGA